MAILALLRRRAGCFGVCVCVCGGQPTLSLRASKWFVMSLQQLEVRSHQLYSAFHTLQPMVRMIRINGIWLP